MIREVLKVVEDKWQAIPIAVTSDCGGESLAARIRIVAERPKLVGPDCYAHQVDRTAYTFYIRALILAYRSSS